MKHFATTYETTVSKKSSIISPYIKTNVSANSEIMFQFTATFDSYTVKHYEYTRWNIFGGTKNEMDSLNRMFL